jgi:hypothetical protein
MPDRPALRVITPDATPDEVAAIVAAVAATFGRAAPPPATTGEPRSRWVTAARLSSRRATVRRGEWRLSGRIGRRTRA